MSNFLQPTTRIRHFDDGAAITTERQRVKSGTFERHGVTRVGPNHVHAFVTHPDGTITDCGVSLNLLTNIGRDWMSGTHGGALVAGGDGSPATASSATSITATGTPWTASNLASPQLGLAGFRVYASVTGVTTPPVWGNIVSNTTSVATIDKWWSINSTTNALATGTTPSSTCGYVIGSGGLASAQFMALTTDSGAASAADTVLASEITTNGLGRALATYAHTMGASTFTLQKAFTATGTVTAVHKMGLFACLTVAGADPMIYETVLNVDATLASSDVLTVTDTVTCSG